LKLTGLLAQTSTNDSALPPGGMPGGAAPAQAGPSGPSAGPSVTIQSTTAPGTAGGAAQPGPFDFMRSSSLLFLLLIVLWVFMLRSSRTKNKQQEKMLAAVRKGDEIQTVGGMLGRVVEVRDDRIQVKVDESANTKIWFARSAIQKVLAGESSPK
jgi:preprotein translocase subunit YajC